jgi:hypothetical protein
MDYFEQLIKQIKKNKIDIYMIETRNIIRIIDSLDAKTLYKLPTFEEKDASIPQYIIIEKTKTGYIELLTGLPLGSSFGNHSVYCDFKLLEKIYSDKDLMRCYDGNYDIENLQLVASNFEEFHNLAQSINKSIKTKILKKDLKYN